MIELLLLQILSLAMSLYAAYLAFSCKAQSGETSRFMFTILAFILGPLLNILFLCELFNRKLWINIFISLWLVVYYEIYNLLVGNLHMINFLSILFFLL